LTNKFSGFILDNEAYYYALKVNRAWSRLGTGDGEEHRADEPVWCYYKRETPHVGIAASLELTVTQEQRRQYSGQYLKIAYLPRAEKVLKPSKQGGFCIFSHDNYTQCKDYGISYCNCSKFYPPRVSSSRPTAYGLFLEGLILWALLGECPSLYFRRYKWTKSWMLLSEQIN